MTASFLTAKLCFLSAPILNCICVYQDIYIGIYSIHSCDYIEYKHVNIHSIYACNYIVYMHITIYRIYACDYIHTYIHIHTSLTFRFFLKGEKHNRSLGQNKKKQTEYVHFLFEQGIGSA